jgi:hypothetical protein
MTFHDAYHDLEDRFRALADADGDIYVPNVEPSGPVQYVFIAMEPSRGRWARTQQQAKAKVEGGFRNFVADEVGDVVLLHHAIRHYLGTESYHLTDISKGAMFSEHANIDRTERYDRWYPLLKAELALVGPDAQTFAVGKKVAEHLGSRGLKIPVILHYSETAKLHRNRVIRGHETEFEAFRSTVSLEDVLATAEKVLEPVPAWLRDTTLRALATTELTTSKKRLLFAYRLAFDPQQDTTAPRSEGRVGPSPAPRRAPPGDGRLLQRFWSDLLIKASRRSRLHVHVSPGNLTWLSAGAGISGVGYNYVVAQHSARVEVYMRRPNAAENNAVFDNLLRHRDDIDSAYGRELTWQRLDGKVACRISERFDDGGYVDVERWPAIHDQMIDAMIRLEQAMRPFLSRVVA